MLAFFMDHNVPAPITDGLRRRGIDVLTTFEDGAFAWPDAQVLERAKELGRVVMTHDRDFLRLAREYWKSSHEFGGVVYGPQRKLDIGQCIVDLELITRG
ncbi:MAG: DUF5615 family PIN-like protein [Planctomycetaceae bacterium]